jgi:HK97 family phage portal protein
MRNPFARWFERRDITLTPSDGSWWTSGGVTDSGQVVSPTTALSVPAVYACCSILSQDLARTPLKLRQQTGPDTFVDAIDHPLFEILNSLWNPEMTAFQAKHYMQWQLLTYGRAYAEIVRDAGRVVAMWPLDAARMYVTRDPATRIKQWHYSGGVTSFAGAEGLVSAGGPTSAAKMFTWPFDASMPPILELTMETPINRCREIIGTALGLQQYIAKFFANGAKPSGVLKTAAGLTATQTQDLRDNFMAGYSGSANRGRVPVLTGDVTFTPMSQNNDDSQMNQTLKALSMAICGAFRIPPWKAGLMESTTYSNMESGELTYVTSVLDPLFEAWEEALRRDVLTVRQYNAYSVTFDRGSLVRNDVKNLYPSLSQGIQNGFLSQNDARKALGLNPIPNGDVFMMNSALQPVGTPPEVPVVA